MSAAPVRTKRRDTGDIICSGKCGSGAAGRCGVSGRLLLAKVRGGCRSRDLSAPLTRSAGGRIDWRPHVLVGFSIVNNRPETMERILLQPMVCCHANRFTQSALIGIVSPDGPLGRSSTPPPVHDRPRNHPRTRQRIFSTPSNRSQLKNALCGRARRSRAETRVMPEQRRRCDKTTAAGNPRPDARP